MNLEEQKVSLCKYADVLFQELEKRIDLRFLDIEKRIDASAEAERRALDLSNKILDRRLEAMNEFRSAMSDQALTFIRRDEFVLHTENQRRELDAFTKFKEERVSVPTDIEGLKKDVKALNTFRDNMDGKASQNSVVVALIFSILAAAFGGISLVLRLLEK